MEDSVVPITPAQPAVPQTQRQPAPVQPATPTQPLQQLPSQQLEQKPIQTEQPLLPPGQVAINPVKQPRQFPISKKWLIILGIMIVSGFAVFYLLWTYLSEITSVAINTGFGSNV